MSMSESKKAPQRTLSARLTTEAFNRASLHQKLSTISYLIAKIQREPEKSVHAGKSFLAREFSEDFHKLKNFSKQINVSPVFEEIATAARSITLNNVKDDRIILSNLKHWDGRSEHAMKIVAQRICEHHAAAWEDLSGIPFHVPHIKFRVMDEYGYVTQVRGKRGAVMALNAAKSKTDNPLDYCDTVFHEDLHVRGFQLAHLYKKSPSINLGPLADDAELFSLVQKTGARIPSKFGDIYKEQFDEAISFYHAAEFAHGIRRILIRNGIYGEIGEPKNTWR